MIDLDQIVLARIVQEPKLIGPIDRDDQNDQFLGQDLDRGQDVDPEIGQKHI